MRARPQTRKVDAVSATILYMSISLDGFVAGPNEGPGKGSARPLGVGYQGTPGPPHPRAILTRLSTVPPAPVPSRPPGSPPERTLEALSQLAWAHAQGFNPEREVPKRLPRVNADQHGNLPGSIRAQPYSFSRARSREPGRCRSRAPVVEPHDAAPDYKKSHTTAPFASP
jgi:hypothetical protein